MFYSSKQGQCEFVVRDELLRLPSRWVVLTGAILVTMWVIGMRLSTICMQWLKYDNWFGPKRHFMRRRPPSEPPDKVQKFQTALEELIQQERALASPPSLMDRLFRRKPQGIRRRLLLQALIAAEQIEASILGQHNLCRSLRKYKRGG